MGIYKYISSKAIVARVIDNVGSKLPGHYFQPMMEWIAQGISMLKTKYQLIERSTGNYKNPDTGEPDLDAIFTFNHVAPLPVDMIDLIAVEDMYGERVREASAVVDFTNLSDRYSTGKGSNANTRATNWQTDVTQHGANNIPTDGSDIKQADFANLPLTYKIQGSMIQTSHDCAFVKIYYYTVNRDKDGYLLVPDVEEYKQALTFYVLRQLVGAGFKHPVFKGERGFMYFDQQWEKYAGRALGKIKYPTIDRMEKLRTGFAERIIPPRHAYADFFVGIEQVQGVNQI